MCSLLVRVLIVAALVTLLGTSIAQEPRTVTFGKFIRRSVSETDDIWPQIKGANFYASWNAASTSRENEQSGNDGNLHSVFSREFVRNKREFRGFTYEGRIFDIKAGEQLVLPFALVKTLSSDHRQLTASVLIDDDAKEVERCIARGFAICTNSLFINTVDNQSLNYELLEVRRSDGPPNTYVADMKIGTYEKFNKRTVKVGDILDTHFYKQKVIHIAPPHEPAKRRGWIVLEPVIAEPFEVGFTVTNPIFWEDQPSRIHSADE